MGGHPLFYGINSRCKMDFQQNFPVDKLIPYARNSRTHNDEQIAQIMASIKEFGFTNPILIGSNNVIIAGHGRLLAAQRQCRNNQL